MFEARRQKQAQKAQESERLAAEAREHARLLADYERHQREEEEAAEAAAARVLRAQREKQWAREAQRTAESRLERTAPAGAPVDVAVEAHLDVDLEDAADMWRDDLVRSTRKHIRPGEQVLGLYLDPVRKKTAYIALTDGFVVRAGTKTFRSNAPIDQDGFSGWNVLIGGDIGWLGWLGWANDWLDQVNDVRKAIKRASKRAAAHTAAAAQRRPGTTPAPRLIRTAQDAELVAAEWMQVMGFPDERDRRRR